METTNKERTVNINDLRKIKAEIAAHEEWVADHGEWRIFAPYPMSNDTLHLRMAYAETYVEGRLEAAPSEVIRFFIECREHLRRWRDGKEDWPLPGGRHLPLTEWKVQP